MTARGALTVGSAAECDLVLQGPGVAARHVRVYWRAGLVVHDLGAGVTLVDGERVRANEMVELAGSHVRVQLGTVALELAHPLLLSLYAWRTSRPLGQGPALVGSDASLVHVCVEHAAVAPVHVQLDPQGAWLTDNSTFTGTFSQLGQRLPPGQPVELDRQAGYLLGPVWLPSAALLELLWQPPAPAPPSAPGVALSSNPNPLAVAQPSSAGSAFGASPPLTVPASGPELTGKVPASRPQRTYFGELFLSSPVATAVVGRSPECQIVLPYPQLSQRHASIALAPDGQLVVTDLGSTNGTYIRGVRVPPHVPVAVPSGERIFVGPYAMIVACEGSTLRAYIDQDRPEWSGNLVELEALELSVAVPDRERKGERLLLDRVTFKARPGDFIAVLGASGAGKTTLLNVLTGYQRPTSGEVRINGENLLAVYDALRGSLGYVPQDDLVHPELTVREAVTYSARFRLPPDYSESEIAGRVDAVLLALGLESVADLEIGRPERKVLSGGQRKRVNIALELVTDPALLFLDEPTSGLAADDTVALIDLLARLAREQGKTILATIHQPAREEYEKFNLALILGVGGQPAYYGPTGRESYEFFGRHAQGRGEVVDTPRALFDQLRHREEAALASGQFPSKHAARVAAAKAWRKEYYQPDNPIYRRMYGGPRAPGTPGQSAPPRRAPTPRLRQLKLLLSRYWLIKRRDRSGLAVTLVQAPVIGLLLGAVFRDSAPGPHLWCRLMLEQAELRAGAPASCALNLARFPAVSDLSSAVFFLVVAALWLGTSNAAREIVSEQAIYRRERAVNLSVLNYVASKFVLLSALGAVQCGVMLGFVHVLAGLGGGSRSVFLPMWGVLTLTTVCASALGLLLSTLVTSTEAAMALTPLALIPQVVLGGRLVPMTAKRWLEPVMTLIPSRWAFEALLSLERKAVRLGWHVRSCLPAQGASGFRMIDCALDELRQHGARSGALGFRTFDRPWIAVGMLCGLTVGLLVLVMGLLRRRDPL